jgi:hypothetical protein
MPKATIRNLTNSPLDLDGGQRLPAMGSVTDEFDDRYLAALRGAPGLEVTDMPSNDGDGEAKPTVTTSKARAKSKR